MSDGKRKGISDDVMKKLGSLEERELTAAFIRSQSEEHVFSRAFENRMKKRFSGSGGRVRRHQTWKVIACAVILILATTVGAAAGVILRKDPVAAADENVLFAFIPEETEPPEVLTEGICPRCGEGTIEAVCSHEYAERDGNVAVLEDCDDPTHPEGCQKKITYCYTNYAHIGCPAEYFNSGTETHVESVEHTLAESDCTNVCHLPVCIPKWMEDSHP